jgi:predicted DNA binding CopG/RHH family protein
MRPDQIVEFLEGFRILRAQEPRTKSRLISMKIQETLLETFKTKARLNGIPYQSQIKLLMRAWLSNDPAQSAGA